MVTGLAVGIGAGSMLAADCRETKSSLAGSARLDPDGILRHRDVLREGVLRLVGSDAVGVGARWRIVYCAADAYLQQRSEKGEKGRMIATNNLYKHARRAAGLRHAVAIA